jgi:hypothetical protein
MKKCIFFGWNLDSDAVEGVERAEGSGGETKGFQDVQVMQAAKTAKELL